jgi:hypothetical protein
MLSLIVFVTQSGLCWPLSDIVGHVLIEIYGYRQVR